MRTGRKARSNIFSCGIRDGVIEINRSFLAQVCRKGGSPPQEEALLYRKSQMAFCDL